MADETNDLKIALVARESGLWPNFKEELQAGISQPIRPLYVDSCPETNAFRLFFGSLLPPADVAPDLGVLYARGQDMPDPIAAFEVAERHVGIRNIPLIYIRSEKEQVVDEARLKNRRYRVLTPPVSINDVLEFLKHR